MPEPRDDFDAVLAACRTGDPDGIEAVYRAYATDIRGFLRSQGLRHEEADDVTSETFVGIVRDVGGFEGDERQFRSWVFTIARHRLIDFRRSGQRRPSEPAEHAMMAAVADPLDVEATALDKMGEAKLLGILDTLTDEQRQVLMMRLFAGMTVSEVAEAMGKRTGAIKALQRRGLAALEAKLPPHQNRSRI